MRPWRCRTGWASARLAGAGTDIRLHGAEDPALVVQADAVALGRLLDNLIGNALNHGAPPVDVTLHQEGRHAVLDVADHGPGIAPEPPRGLAALQPPGRRPHPHR